jgi:type IV pilus assembly protein PilV
MKSYNSSVRAKPNIHSIHSSKGFTLIEVLIAFIILTVGLLGTVALQTSAKQASYDANQRSAALALANDIVERIRANDTAEVLTHYSTTLTHNSPLNEHSCLNTNCSPTDMAAYDLYQWHKSLKMADNTGTLANGVICINPVSSDGKGMTLQVVVAWQGRQELTEVTNKTVDCGSFNELRRRKVILDTYVYMRSA